jgi:hypothetical protein
MNLPQAKLEALRALPDHLSDTPPVVTVCREWRRDLHVYVARVTSTGQRDSLAIGVSTDRSEALERMVEDSKWWASLEVAA